MAEMYWGAQASALGGSFYDDIGYIYMGYPRHGHHNFEMCGGRNVLAEGEEWDGVRTLSRRGTLRVRVG
jgi:hypothetical protein